MESRREWRNTADAPDLGSGGATHGGSTPPSRTTVGRWTSGNQSPCVGPPAFHRDSFHLCSQLISLSRPLPNGADCTNFFSRRPFGRNGVRGLPWEGRCTVGARRSVKGRRRPVRGPTGVSAEFWSLWKTGARNPFLCRQGLPRRVSDRKYLPPPPHFQRRCAP
jgi:hypothetical protein